MLDGFRPREISSVDTLIYIFNARLAKTLVEARNNKFGDLDSSDVWAAFPNPEDHKILAAFLALPENLKERALFLKEAATPGAINGRFGDDACVVMSDFEKNGPRFNKS